MFAARKKKKKNRFSYSIFLCQKFIVENSKNLDNNVYIELNFLFSI